MKKRLFRIIIALLIVGTIIATGKFDVSFNDSTVRAFGDLNVDFHVPLNAPIFVVNNMKPGDTEEKPVDVTNGGSVARLISVRGVRTGGTSADPSADPKLETVLDIIIRDGAIVTPLYGSGSATGPKTLLDFFTDSTSASGVQLSIINSGDHKTYTFQVTLPESAGNEFQNKSVIFDLTFGVITSDNLVINEIYYLVDNSHGLDSPKDRGIVSVNGNNVTLNISGNGAGSKSTIKVNINDACKITQSNNTTIQNKVNSKSNTGKNKSSNNTGGTTSIVSGVATSIVSIVNDASNNQATDCGKKLGQNNEWIELYNPTDHDISLKNWTLTDNSGNPTTIHPNKIIKAGGFALLSKSASTWNFWNEDPNAIKVELGGNIGDGLDNSGDHLILKDPNGTEIDRMSWGSDTSGFAPPATNSLVSVGNSTERLVPGFDTNAVSDWKESLPTPGN